MTTLTNAERCARWKAKHPGRQKSLTHAFMAKRRAWLNEQKSGPCMDCKVLYHPCVMEFDHVRGEKTMDVARMYARFGLQKVIDEIAKCDLVCANCHRLRTFARGWGVKARHG